MKTSMLALAALGWLSLGQPRPVDQPTFAPKEDSSVRKTFSEETELDLDLYEVSVNGEMNSPTDLVLNVNSTRNIVVTDEYGGHADGRLTKLSRLFEELDCSVEAIVGQSGEENESLGEGESELVDAEVEFRWDEDEEEYVAAWVNEDDQPAEAFLAGLREDMDLRAFLPSGEVEDGESWEVDAAALTAILRPGGDLHLLPNDIGDDNGETVLLCFWWCAAEIGDEASGEATATWNGVEEGFGRIDIELEVSFDRDVTDEMIDLAEELANESSADPPEFDEMTVSFDLSGTVSILWDMEAGRVSSYEFEGDSTVLMEGLVVQDMGSASLELELRMELSGATTLTLKTEAL